MRCLIPLALLYSTVDPLDIFSKITLDHDFVTYLIVDDRILIATRGEILMYSLDLSYRDSASPSAFTPSAFTQYVNTGERSDACSQMSMVRVEDSVVICPAYVACFTRELSNLSSEARPLFNATLPLGSRMAHIHGHFYVVDESRVVRVDTEGVIRTREEWTPPDSRFHTALFARYNHVHALYSSSQQFHLLSLSSNDSGIWSGRRRHFSDHSTFPICPSLSAYHSSHVSTHHLTIVGETALCLHDLDRNHSTTIALDSTDGIWRLHDGWLLRVLPNSLQWWQISDGSGRACARRLDSLPTPRPLDAVVTGQSLLLFSARSVAVYSLSPPTPLAHCPSAEWSAWIACGECECRMRGDTLSVETNCPSPSTLSTPAALPDFLWNDWTAWTPYEPCDCGQQITKRSRRCLGAQCAGCSTEYSACNATCSVTKRWGVWTEWTSASPLPPRTRYRPWCTQHSQGIKKQTERRSHPYEEWSPWQSSPHSASTRFRIRSSVEVQGQCPSCSCPPCGRWLAVVSCSSLLIGFIIHCIIHSCCQCKQKIDKPKYYYGSLHSGP